MPNPENKVKFGLKNVHFAIATIAADGSATYGTPVPFPGAVSLSMDPQGENTPFYADNIVYWVGAANSGYEGDLEMALFSDAFRSQVLDELTDSNGVVLEDVDVEPVHFALLFQFDHDKNNTRHILYNCTATRPSVGSATTEDSREPQTESSTITATSIHVSSLDKDIVKARVTQGNSKYSTWFDAVYLPTAVSSGTGSGTS